MSDVASDVPRVELPAHLPPMAENHAPPIQRTTLLDWAIAAVAPVEVPVTPQLMEALTEHFRVALMGGWRIGSFSEYAMLGAASREALEEAASQLRIRSVLEA